MACVRAQMVVLTRRPTVVEGLYSGLGSGAALTATQLDVKMKLLVEAPAAVEDALASLLDHHDATLQVGPSIPPCLFTVVWLAVLAFLWTTTTPRCGWGVPPRLFILA